MGVGIVFIIIIVIGAFAVAFNKNEETGERVSSFAKGCGFFIVLVILVLIAAATIFFKSMP